MPEICRPGIKKVLEKDVREAIRAALGREPDLFLMLNTIAHGTMVDRSGAARHQHAGLPKGSADLIGVLAPLGRIFALEVKRSPRELPRPLAELEALPHRNPAQEHEYLQQLWAANVRKRGGFAAFVSSVDEAWAALGRARKGAVQ